MSVLLAFLSLVLESQTGYPDRLYKAIGHPVSWIGSLISSLDRMLNRATESDRRRRLYGVLALDRHCRPSRRHRRQPRAPALCPIAPGLPCWRSPAARCCRSRASPITSRRSPTRWRPTASMSGRKAVSKIVGRDPEQLDEAGVCARRHREPGREFFRRHRRAGLLAGARRAGAAASPTRPSTPPIR